MSEEDRTDQPPGWPSPWPTARPPEPVPTTESAPPAAADAPTGRAPAAMLPPGPPPGPPLVPPPWPTARPPEPAGPKPPSRSSRAPVWIALVTVIALLAGAAGAAVGVAVSEDSSSAPNTSSFVPPGSRNDNGSFPDGLGSELDVNGIAERVSPAIVNIATTLTGGQRAAGSGMVLTSSGEVLTNNHVINGATKIQVEIGVTGKTHTAKVLGYDIEDDVALLKLNDASGMKTITTASASTVSKNDAVVAIGNALGRFGTPTAVGGTVTALHQNVTAGDGLDQESLSDMIRIAASIQPGDSGGALVDDRGRVIGMNTAADAGSGRFGFQSGTTGFAIPIGNALEIAEEIKDGDTSNGAHIGDRALLGVVLREGQADDPFGNDGGGDTGGAAISDVSSDAPAADAGMEAGDTITALDGHTVRSADDLRTELDRYHPGDKVTVEWTDADGDDHRAKITLIKGPPA